MDLIVSASLDSHEIVRPRTNETYETKITIFPFIYFLARNRIEEKAMNRNARERKMKRKTAEENSLHLPILNTECAENVRMVHGCVT